MNHLNHKIYYTRKEPIFERLKSYGKITLYSAFALTVLIAPFLKKTSAQDPYHLREEYLDSVSSIVKDGKLNDALYYQLRKEDIAKSLAYFELTPQKLEQIIKNIHAHKEELLENAKVLGVNISEFEGKKIQDLLQAASSRFTPNEQEFLKEARKFLLLNETQIDQLLQKATAVKAHTGAESTHVIIINLLILALFLFAAHKFDKVTDEMAIIENRNKDKRFPLRMGTEHLDLREDGYFMMLMITSGIQIFHAMYKAIDLI